MGKCIMALVFLVVGTPCLAVPMSVGVMSSADVFVRSVEPDANYGGAGALSVSGSAAVNASAYQMGLLDSFIRFDLSEAVVNLDSEFGSGGWSVNRALFTLVEQGAPNNPIFNRGVGLFEVRWIANDSWVEGTGNPKTPTTDGVTYQDVPSLLDAALDVSLGTFGNSGADGELTFELDLAGSFISDITAGGEVSFYLTAADNLVGFTFDSRKLTAPSLQITADAVPHTWPIPGDVNGDCFVNILDMIAIRNHLGDNPASPPENAAYDVNEDGFINVVDMIFVRNHLNDTCEQSRSDTEGLQGGY